tara:strand:- start:10329 stop:11141 length:813 start_codon:yes stop_codon:yes gene_type:complete
MLDWTFPTLYLILLLFAAEAVRKRVKSDKVEWLMAAATLVVIGAFQYKTLAHLPMKDYRPYSDGESIVINRMSAEELGLEAPKYAYEWIFKNNNTGKDTIVLSNDWSEKKYWDSPWFTSTYEKVKKKDYNQVTISEGYEPRILDFKMLDEAGEDLADSLLNTSGYTFLHISKDLDASGAAGQTAFNAIAESALAEGHSFYGLTNVDYDASEDFRHEHQAPYDFLTCDQTELKIIVRSNPGLVLLKEGVVVEKWAWRDVPLFDDIKDSLIK